MEDQDFLRNEIEKLDAEIAKLRETISRIENGQISADAKALEIIRAKLADWTEKRNTLLEILIKQIRS